MLPRALKKALNLHLNITGNYWANFHLTILPEGDVYACRCFKSRIGNVFSEKLHYIFTSEMIDSFRDYEKYEKCSNVLISI
jgi:radical SAM protein with 4Fe4S-binding SPASM domain